MSMRPKTVAERIATIAARCHRRRLMEPVIQRHGARCAWLGRLERARLRREQLEEERPHWERLIREHRGNVRQIAYAIGCCEPAARRAIWDLGLWPDLVREREAVRGEAA
jgi:hypothetical protein